MGIYDTMRELENISKKIKIYTYFPAVYLCGGFILLLLDAYGVATGVFLVGTIVWVIITPQVSVLQDRYNILYRETFVVSVLKTMLDDVKYEWNNGFTKFEAMQSGLIKIGNEFFSEDYLSGSYKGVKFRQSDVESINVTQNSEGEEIAVTYFSGRLIEIEYPLKINTGVKVMSKYFVTFLGLLDEVIDMEDVEFNEDFNVYSLDAHEAFYILTPHLMEKIKTITKKYDRFAFNFSQGKIYFALQNRNVFETEYKTKISYVEEQERMKKDVQVIIDIVNMLGLI